MQQFLFQKQSTAGKRKIAFYCSSLATSPSRRSTIECKPEHSVQVNCKAILKANTKNRSVDRPAPSLVSKSSFQTVLQTFTNQSEVSVEPVPLHKESKVCFLKKAPHPPKTVEVTIQPQETRIKKKPKLHFAEVSLEDKNTLGNKKLAAKAGDKAKKPAAVCKTHRTKEKKQKDQLKLQEMKTSQIGKKKRKPLPHLAVTMIQDGPEVLIS